MRLGAARWLVLRDLGLFDHGNRLDLRDVRAEKVNLNGGSGRCMLQEQVLYAIPSHAVISRRLMADLSLGAKEVVGMACLCDHQPTVLFADDQAVVVHLAKVPEQLRDTQRLVGKLDYGSVIEDVVDDETKSVRNLVPPCVSSKPFHQLEAFVVFKMEADLHPGEPSVLGQSDALIETAWCLIRTKNLG